MRSTAAQLARDLAAMRSGHGPRRQELRAKLMSLPLPLRSERNREKLRLAQLRHQLQTDMSRDPTALRAAIEQSGQRLAALDQEIARRIAEGELEAAPVAKPAQQADPVDVREARRQLRARLTIAVAMIDGAVPAAAVHAVRRQIAKLSG